MNRILIPLALVAIIYALFEQQKPEPNKLVLAIAAVLVVWGIARLSAKIPSKNQTNDTDDTDKER